MSVPERHQYLAELPDIMVSVATVEEVWEALRGIMKREPTKDEFMAAYNWLECKPHMLISMADRGIEVEECLFSNWLDIMPNGGKPE